MVFLAHVLVNQHQKVFTNKHLCSLYVRHSGLKRLPKCHECKCDAWTCLGRLSSSGKRKLKCYNVHPIQLCAFNFAATV